MYHGLGSNDRQPLSLDREDVLSQAHRDQLGKERGKTGEIGLPCVRERSLLPHLSLPLSKESTISISYVSQAKKGRVVSGPPLLFFEMVCL